MYRRPQWAHVLQPAKGIVYGVDVDCRLLLRAGPRNLFTLPIRMDIPVPRVAHAYEAPGFEGESEPSLLPPPSKSGVQTAAAE